MSEEQASPDIAKTPNTPPAASNAPVKIRGRFVSYDPSNNTCEFVVDRPVLEGWSVIFRDAEEGLDSPLIDAVFSVEGIDHVKVADSVLTVVKKTDTPWPTLAKDLVPRLKAAFEQDRPVLSMAVMQALRDLPTGGSMEELIKDLFKHSINPALASHGGFVRLDRVVDRDVYLEMGGGCQGCSASQVTLKEGIEKAIRGACPQVREIVDITDHEAGATPYYS